MFTVDDWILALVGFLIGLGTAVVLSRSWNDMRGSIKGIVLGLATVPLVLYLTQIKGLALGWQAAFVVLALLYAAIEYYDKERKRKHRLSSPVR